MTTPSKLAHGSAAWFDMVGAIMCNAAIRAALPATANVSLLERYIDGVVMANDLVQGLRFDIKAGRPSYRPGAGITEYADIIIDITAAASLRLNTLHADDPAFSSALETFQQAGQMRIQGDFSRIGDWFDSVHDAIVKRTGPPAVAASASSPLFVPVPALKSSF